MTDELIDTMLRKYDSREVLTALGIESSTDTLDFDIDGPEYDSYLFNKGNGKTSFDPDSKTKHYPSAISIQNLVDNPNSGLTNAHISSYDLPVDGVILLEGMSHKNIKGNLKKGYQADGTLEYTSSDNNFVYKKMLTPYGMRYVGAPVEAEKTKGDAVDFAFTEAPETFDDKDLALLDYHRNTISDDNVLYTTDEENNTYPTTVYIRGITNPDDPNSPIYSVPGYVDGKILDTSSDRELQKIAKERGWFDIYPADPDSAGHMARVEKIKEVINQDGEKLSQKKGALERAGDVAVDTAQASVTGMEKGAGEFNDFLALLAGSPDMLADVLGQRLTGNPNFNYPGFTKESAKASLTKGLLWLEETFLPESLQGVSTKNIEDPYTNKLYGSIIEGVAQFATGAIPAAKVVKATNFMNGLLAKNAVVRGLVWGALADAAVFAPDDPQILDMLTEFIPSLNADERNELTDFVLSVIEKNDADSEWIKRYKAAGEGAVVGVLAEGVIAAAKVLPWKRFAAIVGPIATAAVNAAKRVEIDHSATLGSGRLPIRIGDNNPPSSTEPFYSAVENAVNALSMKKGTGEQILKTLQNVDGVRQEELDWIGLTDYLKTNKNVTKEDVQKYVKENKMRLEEVTLTGENKAVEDSEFVIGRSVENTEGILDWRDTYGEDHAIREIIDDFDGLRKGISNKIELRLREKNKTPPYSFELQEQVVKEIMDTKNTYDDLSDVVKREIEDYAVDRMDEMYYNRDYGMAVERLVNDASGVTIQGNNEVGWQIFRNEDLADRWQNAEDIDPIYNREEAEIQANNFAFDEGLFKEGPRHETWTIPGGSDYKEILFIKDEAPRIVKYDKAGKPYTQDRGTFPADMSHHNRDDIIAHIRIKTRTDKSGAKVLFAEEIQSDWLQKGRKEGFILSKEEAEESIKIIRKFTEDIVKTFNGYTIRQGGEEIPFYDWLRTKKDTYSDGTKRDAYSDAIAEEGALEDKVIWSGDVLSDAYAELIENAKAGFIYKNGKQVNEINEITQVKSMLEERSREGMKHRRRIPDAPLKKKWQETMFRRLARMAAEEGYDKVSWSPAAVLNKEHYGLSRRIHSLDWEHMTETIVVGIQMPGYSPGMVTVNKETGKILSTSKGFLTAFELDGLQLADVIDKKIADKMLTQKSGAIRDVVGLDPQTSKSLWLGSKKAAGMVTFYDTMLRDYASKWAKKFNSTVYVNRIKGDYMKNFNEISEFQDDEGYFDAWTMDITPEMKESVLQKGVPLFSVGGAATVGASMQQKQQQENRTY